MSARFDLAIVGGGFSGSLLALIARSLGLRVALIDRGRHPRFAIGESSTPAGNMILAALIDRYGLQSLRGMPRYGTWKGNLPSLDVGPKRGFSYFHHEPGSSWAQDAGHANELLVAASDSPVDCDTHWYRPDVDAWLFAEAGRCGATTLPGRVVSRVDRIDLWQLDIGEGDRVEAEVLVDATGGGAFSAEHLGVDEGPDLRTNTRAWYAHFQNLETWQSTSGLDTADHPFPADHAALHHVLENAWMWQLRFDSGRTSVGIVRPGKGTPSLDGALARYPSLTEQFVGARRVSAAVTTGRLQRRKARAGGQGWALLPHAAGFVDPLHSTGIALSLAGIERLARILASGSTGFETYGSAVLQEIEHLDSVVAVCYDAMDDFERFTTATMLYFAASIRFERKRAAEGQDFRGLFLGADDSALVRVIAEAQVRVRQDHFREWMARSIEPWNDARLLKPPVPNMYRHTVPRG